MKSIAAAVALVLTATAAFAEPSLSRSFYDNRGSFAGSSVTRGNATSVYDRNGRFDGTVIRNSDGTNSFYDRNGHFTGSITNTTPSPAQSSAASRRAHARVSVLAKLWRVCNWKALVAFGTRHAPELTVARSDHAICS